MPFHNRNSKNKVNSCSLAVRGVVRKGSKVLLVQRVDKGRFGGRWELPGGKTDCQEPKKALKREIKEEVGLKVISAKPLKTKFDGKYWTRYYNAKAHGNIKIQHSELQGVGWFNKNQYKNLNLTPNTRKYLR
jgi:8-oxo-dGTP pyrophosphatase MutT (NUDIX family)